MGRSAFDVLIYVPFPSNTMTGGPRSMLALMSGLGIKGYSVGLLTHKHSALSEACEELQLPVIMASNHESPFADSTSRKSKLPVSTLASEFQATRRCVRSVLKDLDVKLICARNALAVTLISASARRINIPVVWDIGLEARQWAARWTFNLTAAVTANRIILQSDQLLREALPVGFPRLFNNKTVVNPPGVSKGKRHELDVIADSRRARSVRSRADPLNLVCIGTLTQRKNQLGLVRAAYEAACVTGCRIVIDLIGEADLFYRQAIERELASLDSNIEVRYEGWRDDISTYLVRCDALCIPSLAEGMPQTFREAILAGVPVICSGVGGMRGMLSNQETGLLFDPRHVDELVDCLIFSINEPRVLDGFGWRAKELLSPQFSEEAWLLQYSAIISELCGEYSST